MLECEDPWLLLLLVPAILAGFFVSRLKKPSLLVSALLPNPRTLRVRMAQFLRTTGPSTILALLVIAAANPRLPDLKTRLPVEGISIMMILDTSNSMASADFTDPRQAEPVSRLAAAQQAFTLFVRGGDSPAGTVLKGRPQDRVGLITFAAVPRTVCPLTLNHSVLTQVLAEQKVQTGLNAGTNIGDALAEGVIRIVASGEQRRGVLILLSDGEHNKLGNEALLPLQAAQLAAKYRIPIYTIDCGGAIPPSASPEERKQREDGRQVLEGVATLTEGRSFVADDVEQLNQVTQTIDQLERTPELSFRYRKYENLGPRFAAMAAGLIVLIIFLEGTVLRIAP
jgi:Ca-activated chloride channel family protein